MSPFEQSNKPLKRIHTCSCKQATMPLLYCSGRIIRFHEFLGIFFHAFIAVLPNSRCLDLSNFIPVLSISPPPPPPHTHRHTNTHAHAHTKAHTEELDFGSVLSIGHDSFGQCESKLISMLPWKRCRKKMFDMSLEDL